MGLSRSLHRAGSGPALAVGLAIGWLIGLAHEILGFLVNLKGCIAIVA